MDFYKIRTRAVKSSKKGLPNEVEIYPDFLVTRSSDLMIRGKGFGAIWDQDRNLWSTDEYDVQRLIDKDLREYKERMESNTDSTVHAKYMGDFSTGSWAQFRKYMTNMSDNYHVLDEKLTFQNDEVTKKDHVSKRLPYPLVEGNISSWNELVGTLYEPEERQKIEWGIGAIVAGEAKDIQKFIVIYGPGGAGKSTILNIIQKLFVGYYTMFEAKALTSNNNAFSTEAFRGNPLVAIQHDGDLSRIEDNAKLNSVISHEEMVINEKFKPSYPAKINCFLFIGTNKPVKITDAKSGIIRRLIDVRTSGKTLPVKQYQTLLAQIDFELGAIAHHCLEVYRKLGKNHYSSYKPVDMILQTDVFYNFVESNYYTFHQADGTTLKQAWEMYKTYCEESSLEYKLPLHKFRDELKNYFKLFEPMSRATGKQQRSVFIGFLAEKFDIFKAEPEVPMSLSLESEESLLDELCATYPAQYASPVDLVPEKRWANVTTTLSDLDTKKLHYVKFPPNHIVIDFDLKGPDGEKSAELNLEAASMWPPTYAEYSKSHKGIHLHYFYDGDPEKLARSYSDGIEIKVFNGDASLRRMLSKCNTTPVAHINSGLPLKGEKVIDFKAVTSERGLRELIVRNLNKEIHPGTKSSIDFIYKILEDAYSSGLKYDVTTLRPKVLTFAVNSTNQSEYCVKLVSKMKFQSAEPENIEEDLGNNISEEDLVFYDVEVFSNLFVVCWKYRGKDKQKVHMVNPGPKEIEDLLKLPLVGFNNRRYDNHILYARLLGYDNEQLFDLSKKIVGDSSNGYFREAYEISYTDVYDFASAGNKKSLKKWEVDLGIHHKELGHPWDQPVPEEMWPQVVEYCDNDVDATEVVFDYLSGDWAARKVVAELSGLSVNHTTNQHATKIIFGDDKNTESHLVYTDLSEMFPGYTFDSGKSTYRGEEVGEGGWVYSEPGMYDNVAVLDVASMHPASIVALNLLGKYTKRYSDLREARIAIKRNNREVLETILDGKLLPFIQRADEGGFKLKDLSEGLKTVLNSAYGLTSASFPNKFKDQRNIDNIVAKRGALFMIDLKNAVQEKGFQVVHVKTDSIKIPNPTTEIISFVFEFGKKYGYEFEHESTYAKFCLVNDAVYIAKEKEGKHAGEWTATGAQFAHPFVFKTLFSKEKIEFEDLCEVKSVTGNSALYLDMNEDLGEDQHNYHFVGRVGLFCPVEPGTGGGLLMREKEGKYYAATGTKGYRWLEAEDVKNLGISDQIDTSYHERLASEAIKHISKFGDFESFVSE